MPTPEQAREVALEVMKRYEQKVTRLTQSGDIGNDKGRNGGMNDLLWQTAQEYASKKEVSHILPN